MPGPSTLNIGEVTRTISDRADPPESDTFTPAAGKGTSLLPGQPSWYHSNTQQGGGRHNSSRTYCTRGGSNLGPPLVQRASSPAGAFRASYMGGFGGRNSEEIVEVNIVSYLTIFGVGRRVGINRS